MPSPHLPPPTPLPLPRLPPPIFGGPGRQGDMACVCGSPWKSSTPTPFYSWAGAPQVPEGPRRVAQLLACALLGIPETRRISNRFVVSYGFQWRFYRSSRFLVHFLCFKIRGSLDGTEEKSIEFSLSVRKHMSKRRPFKWGRGPGTFAESGPPTAHTFITLLI